MEDRLGLLITFAAVAGSAARVAASGTQSGIRSSRSPSSGIMCQPRSWNPRGDPLRIVGHALVAHHPDARANAQFCEAAMTASLR